MPSDFFILNCINPNYPPDQYTNPFQPSYDQMNFVFIHYPDYNKNPIELLMWLYETALFNENVARAQTQHDADIAYSQKPKVGARAVKGKKTKNNDYDDEEEDTTFGLVKPKKPSAQPTAKTQEISFEVLEKKKKQ